MFKSGNVTNEARKGRCDQQGLKGRSLPAGAKVRSVNPDMILAGATGKRGRQPVSYIYEEAERPTRDWVDESLM